MQPVAERAKELLPGVLLTLTSIIQGLSLEVLWSSASGVPELWGEGSVRLTAWLQVAAVFQVILLIWLYYAQIIMRFRWVPTVRDSVIPFILGLGQFALAELLQPDRLDVWIYTLAAVFVFVVWVNLATFRAAEQDPDNAWFFDTFQFSATTRYGPPGITTALLIALAAITQSVGSRGRWAVAATVSVNLILLAQLQMQRGYWHRSVLQHAQIATKGTA
jgi:hypothetical protein